MTSAWHPELDPRSRAFDEHALIGGLRAILPSEAILLSAEQQRPFECDGLPSLHQRPQITVLPESVHQIQAILRLANEVGVPVVTRGAGTGLSGGALPLERGLLLVLSKLDRILEIDVAAGVARVEPGVRNLAVSEAAAPHGLYYAPDPSSQIACSVGGNVAENAGGVHCLKYGLTVHNVLAVKIVGADGELFILSVDADGPDLLALMIGSEGLLGIVVEIMVKLLPSPPAVQTLLAAFDSVDAAGSAVAAIIGAGIIPAGLEMMDHLALTAAEDFAGAGYPRDAQAILLIELDGGAEEVAADLAACEQVLGDAREIFRARDDAQRALFWKGRKSAFPAVGRLFPDYYCMDGTIPRARIAEVLGYISERAAVHGMPVANVFHAGDGNLHPLILFDGNQDGALETAERFGSEILEKCLAVGGTITGEHGVGREKLDQMASQFNDAELEQMRSLKAAFDPAGLLNPGKLIPTLARCQEYRAIRGSTGP